MNHQVIIVHGGDTFESYEEYLADLKVQEFSREDFENLRAKNWKQALEGNLGTGFEVVAPRMPCKENAKYLEWKIWFEKIVPFFVADAVLIGHSLGGIFLAKYLSENKLPKKIRATLLVSAPFNDDPNDHSIADFILPKTPDPFQEQSPTIYIYHSTDDHVVEYADAETYKSRLSKAELRKFTDRGHFFQEEFPEIVADIKKLFK